MFVLSTIPSFSIAFLLATQKAFANPAPTNTGTLSVLLTRQLDGINTSEIPAACQSSCTPLVNAMSGCTDLNCICSDKNSDLIASCLGCAVSLENTPDNLAAAQGVVDQFVDSCKAAGINVKSQTVSASKKNGTIKQKPALLGAATLAVSALLFLSN